jgi:hypothetical protein
LRFGGFLFCGAYSVKRAQRKKAVAAGRATIGREVCQPEKWCVPAVYYVARHSFDIEVTAHRAVDVMHEGDRDRPRIESNLASEAAPRTQPERTENAILETTALRTSAAPTMTGRTEQDVLLFLWLDGTEYAKREVVAR